LKWNWHKIRRPANILWDGFWGILFHFAEKLKAKGRDTMKQDEKKPIPWEVADPKPPVVESGRMENRKQN